jgi:hypothetical protein
MRKSLGTVLLIMGAASVAAALPTGLSGLGVGGGGLFGDGSAGFVQAEFDFAIPPYASLGPEVGGLFGGRTTALFLGGEGRVYFIPNYNIIIQPHAVFGGGVAIDFEGDTDVAGYIQFGGGMDFDVPAAPMAPYFDMGALIGFGGGGSDAAFKLEGGVRFNLW